MQINATTPSVEIKPTIPQKPENKPVLKEVSKVDKTEKASPEKEENLKKLKEVLSENNITLKFRQDEETKALVVELVDGKTGEAVRQIPSEISLKLAAVFVKMRGQFVDQTE